MRDTVPTSPSVPHWLVVFGATGGYLPDSVEVYQTSEEALNALASAKLEELPDDTTGGRRQQEVDAIHESFKRNNNLGAHSILRYSDITNEPTYYGHIEQCSCADIHQHDE